MGSQSKVSWPDRIRILDAINKYSSFKVDVIVYDTGLKVFQVAGYLKRLAIRGVIEKVRPNFGKNDENLWVVNDDLFYLCRKKIGGNNNE